MIEQQDINLDNENLNQPKAAEPNDKESSIGATSAPSKDAALLSILMAALKENAVCNGLNDDELLSIAEEALELNKVSDAQWLAQKVAFLKGEEYDPNSVVTGAEAATGDEKDKDKFQLDEIKVSERAEIHSREDLEAVLVAHRAWMDSVLNPNSKIACGRANLTDCSLAGFDLEGVDLRGANLKRTDFSGANLRQANLSTADLTQAKFTGAILEGTKLRKAVLLDADFSGANLKSADLRRAELKGAIFSDVELEGVLADGEIKLTKKEVTEEPENGMIETDSLDEENTEAV